MAINSKNITASHVSRYVTVKLAKLSPDNSVKWISQWDLLLKKLKSSFSKFYTLLFIEEEEDKDEVFVYLNSK
jgi:hypothetical protein